MNNKGGYGYTGICGECGERHECELRHDWDGGMHWVPEGHFGKDAFGSCLGVWTPASELISKNSCFRCNKDLSEFWGTIICGEFHCDECYIEVVWP